MCRRTTAFVFRCAFCLGLLLPMAAQGQPQLVWDLPAGPWTSGPSGTTNWSGGGLVEETALVNSFILVGATQPQEVEWTFWAAGQAISPLGSPWSHARLELNGLGWIESGEVSHDPWDVSNATQLWAHFEEFGPPPGPDTWFGGAFGPLRTRFLVQPGVRYALKQWNYSKLNYFDLGYFRAELTSEVNLVPEPWTLTLLGLGLFGAGAGRRFRGR